MASAAARRSSAVSSGPGGRGFTGGGGPSSAPMRSYPPSRRRSAASRSPSSTRPSCTAVKSAAPKPRPGPGISRSRPACSDASVSTVANQSVITSPSKPHSWRRISIRSSGCWVTQRPLTRLYEDMTASAPPFLDRDLERDEIQLAHRAPVDLRAHREPLEFGVVAHEVLHGGEHTFGLDPAHVARRQLPGQERVLGVALEIAPGQRRTVQVHRRREQAPAPAVERVPGHERAQLLGHGRVPRRADGRAARNARRGGTAEARIAEPAGAARTVGDLDAREPQTLDTGGVEHALAGGQRRLLLERERSQQWLRRRPSSSPDLVLVDLVLRA